MKYKSLFFDLDDTLWATTLNSRQTLRTMYDVCRFHRFFASFDVFYQLYSVRNEELWSDYSLGLIDKEELNHERFLYPLRSVGAPDAERMAVDFAQGFFARIPLCSGLMPGALETLDYLHSRYRLYILSNGFRELQSQKMKSAGIDGYFSRVILSDDIGVLKPNVQLFHFALSATQSELRTSLMIGDNFRTDIAGAACAGLDQAFYDPTGKQPTSFTPTLRIGDLRELIDLL